jgi:hypothetical protein
MRYLRANRSLHPPPVFNDKWRTAKENATRVRLCLIAFLLAAHARTIVENARLKWDKTVCTLVKDCFPAALNS